MDAENTELKVFNGGMRLVMRNVADTAFTKVRARIAAGSRDEVFGDHKRGIAHALEHILSKGSRDFPNPSEGSNLIEALGGSISAATDFNHTFIEFEVPSKALPVAMHVLGDTVSHPFLRNEPLQIEKPAIDKEWLVAVMDPSRKLFLDTLYASGGRRAKLYPIIGDKQSIEAINAADVQRFFKEKFTADKVIISAEGDFTGHDVARYAAKYFRLPRGNDDVAPGPHYVGGDLRSLPEPGAAGTRVMLAMPMPAPIEKELSAPFVMLSKLLGGTSEEASLYESLRKKAGLVYGIDVQRRPLPDYGLFTVGFITYAKDVEPALKLIAAKIKDLSEHVGAKALEQQHTFDRGACARRLEERFVGVEDMAEQVAAHGQVLPRDYFFKLQEKVTAEDVQRAAATVLDNLKKVPVTFVASGDMDGLPTPARVAQIFRDARSDMGPVLRELTVPPVSPNTLPLALTAPTTPRGPVSQVTPSRITL